MAALEIRVNGNKRTDAETLKDEKTDNLILETVYDINTATRGDATNSEPVVLDDNKVIELVYSDDSVWIGDRKTVDEVFPGALAQVRGTDATVFELPTEIYTGEQARSGELTKVVLTLVKVFTKKDKLAPKIKELATRLEKKQLNDRSGLYRLTDKFEFIDPKDDKAALGPEGRYLLFLHGTGSSTKGSFGELIGSKVWSYITQTYRENILAFEHETLTKSPLQNVFELIEALPDKATLTLVSHSRGGLVGDVLNRFCPKKGVPGGFSAKEKNYLRKQGQTDDIDCIDKIEKAILRKDITIEKFVRVACTASGTTLASGRLDIYFNVIFNLIGLAAGSAANPAYMAFKDLIAALLESRNDTSALPGLAVQSPTSPFNQALNNVDPETIIDTPLLIIAGDGKTNLRWKGIKVFLSNLYFWEGNDFVVNTRSMYNGAKRTAGHVQYFLDESPDVSHFNYFRSPSTQSPLLLALQLSGETLIPGFSLLQNRGFTEEEVRNAVLGLDGGKLIRNNVTGKKPIVVLLPGIMGSNLTVKEKLLWIDYFRFIGGGLLSLINDELNNPNVKPHSLVGTSYEKLADYLAPSYDVVTFPYDWRLQLRFAAKSLNSKLIELMQHGQPIKVIAHSMGGLVFRDFMINHEETWNELNATKDFRLLFLGSPLGGSYRIPYVLFGQDRMINMLDMIDLTNSRSDLMNVFCNLPGLLNLLPLKDENNDFSNTETWEVMRNAFGEKNWPIPDKKWLDDFGVYQTKILETRDKLNYSNAVYIAGKSRQNKDTPSSYIIKNGVLTFLATQKGDESVTWASGIPKPMLTAEKTSVYYSDVPHGELANQNSLFRAISEILSTGSTSLLRKTEPATRGMDLDVGARPDYDFDLSRQGVERTILGLGTDQQFARGQVPIHVSVSNGDLKYAKYPVVAGHFLNDGILSAEKAIDRHLKGELSRRLRMGIYPGEIGSSEMVLQDDAYGFKGVILIGLGRQGDLTPFLLARSVEQSVCKYLMTHNHATRTGKSPATEQLGISALLIGCGYGGLSIEGSIRAILMGVQNANDKIRQIYQASVRTIDAVEFVELYQDRSLSGVHAISSIERDENRTLNIVWTGNKINKLPGRRERLPVEITNDWWTRINVKDYSADALADETCRQGLYFTISTDAARAEERSLRTHSGTVSTMLEQLSTKGKWTPELAKTLFELLIPNDFKEQIKRQNNINWIVDKYTAAYPWELLQDATGNAMPLSVNAGMIRQLATMDYRIKINPVTDRTALVVGDPNLENTFPQLIGAEAEGQKVAEVLTTKSYTVTSLIKSSADDILLALFSGNYKIVHLAGHGLFSSDLKRPSGMLIGKDAFLTPAEIGQMSAVPELVFVNCCHLGKMSGVDEAYFQSRYRLAANIGTQLIDIGVKAVVVAGWAVSDSAAVEFCEKFYQNMFSGNNFGEAIKKARKAIYDKYRDQNNTWGAYQCYGDPFYTLSGYTENRQPYYEFVIEEEAEIELSNLLNQLDTGGDSAEIFLAKMDAIGKAVEKAAIRNGRITELEALLYSGLNMYGLAIAKFEQLLKEENASFSFSASEKYCNVRAKYYVQEVKDARKKGTLVKGVEENMNKVIRDMEGLTSLCITVERLNLLGSTYKRKAIISEGNTKREAYQAAAANYKDAYYNLQNKNKYYSLVNWLSIELALILAGVTTWEDVEDAEGNAKKGKGIKKKESEQSLVSTPQSLSQKKAEELLNEEAAKIPSKVLGDMTYWELVADVNIRLCRLLLEDTDAGYSDLLDQYIRVWAYIGHAGNRKAEVEHFEFLEDALSMAIPLEEVNSDVTHTPVNTQKAKEKLQLILKLKQSLASMV